MQKKRILLCEDDEDQALLVQDALEDKYALDILPLGQRVFETNLDDYEVILLDYNLPDISGLEVLQEVVRRTEVPAIMLTGEDNIQLAVEALKIGAYNYLVKGPSAYTALPIVVQKTTEEYNQKRKNQELELLLFQKEKTAAIGQLAASTSHEICNPLSFITGNLAFIKEYTQDLETIFNDFLEKLRQDPSNLAQSYLEKFQTPTDKDTPISLIGEIKHAVNDAMEGAERIRRIVQGLLDFSNVQRTELESVNLNKSLANTLQILRYELTQKAKIITEYGDLPSITCYPGQLNQVFMNILIYLSQIIKQKGDIKIKTYQKNKNIFIEISNTGGQIPEKKLSSLFMPRFNPYLSEHEKAVGLNVSYEIIKHHGGEIEVKNLPGSGSKFTIRLPIQPPNLTGNKNGPKNY
ncbi:hypothetical protein DRQ12_05110 [candidate division KSB1 bacterium]|nr:MAG: hypothetical protein DRQ12_05110 [candidate division KSB1 bacterium]